MCLHILSMAISFYFSFLLFHQNEFRAPYLSESAELIRVQKFLHSFYNISSFLRCFLSLSGQKQGTGSCHLQSINQSINQPTNQPTNQSINQSTNKLLKNQKANNPPFHQIKMELEKHYNLISLYNHNQKFFSNFKLQIIQ